MDDVPFKPRAYEKAAQAIESHDRPLDAVYRAGGVKALREIPGIGTSMAEKLEELITTGKSKLREEYHRRMPVDLAALTALQGAGPQAVKLLYHPLLARTAEAAIAAFAQLPAVARVLGQGDTKCSVKLQDGLQVDVRVVPEESFGAALLYFTGSKAHNVALRQLAMKKGWKLNEYGLFRGTRRIAGRTEQELYDRLGLAWIPPELREDQGEIEAARAGTLPRLVEPGDLRGALQTQTNWTDGQDSLEAMARAARDAGCEYVAITDHTVSLAMTGGCDAKKLRRQRREIERLDAKLDGIRVLAGAEVNIDRDGTLDIDDETLAQLDVVGIAVHSHFNLPRREQTDRIVRAMRNPHADILFHPTGRVIARREPYDVDIEAVIAAAKETGTVLELDAYPDRLDLRDEHVRRAIGAGVPIVIDSDAHSVKHLGFPRAYGVDQARRGWATAKDVLNTRPVEAFLAGLKGGRPRARRRA